MGTRPAPLSWVTESWHHSASARTHLMGNHETRRVEEVQEGWSHKRARRATREPGHHSAEGSSPTNFLRQRNTKIEWGLRDDSSPRLLAGGRSGILRTSAHSYSPICKGTGPQPGHPADPAWLLMPAPPTKQHFRAKQGNANADWI